MKPRSATPSNGSTKKQVQARLKTRTPSTRPKTTAISTAIQIPHIQIENNERKLNARPDPIDFRDRMFEPTLIEVPPRIQLAEYLRYGVAVLNQGSEGACTGFGLATVAHYLLRRR